MRGSLISCLLAWATLGLAASSKPNVVLIMTDDQDMLLDSLSVMPKTMSLIAGNGTLYQKHYCTVALCCPSRVNLLTGRAAHNTNVTSLALPYGGYPKFVQEGLNNNYLPVWINNAGANTYYLGKFQNDFGMGLYTGNYPKGWTNMSMLIDPWTYNYFHSHWSNGYTKQLTPYPGVHTTSVIQQKSLDYIDDAAADGKQFFLMIAPVAPHVQIKAGKAGPPPPPPQYANSFTDRVAPRTPNFNPDVPSGAGWVYELAQQNDSQVAFHDTYQVGRLQNLAGIDDMVGAVMQKLEDSKLLDNTYVIFTTDNGFHIGSHRMAPGKRQGYEEDINIPMMIRGPDVPVGFVTNHTQSHTDLAPTILSMMGLPLRGDFDGAPFPITQADLTNPALDTEYVNVEFWDSPKSHPFATHGDGDLDFKPGQYFNNTYKSLRMASGGESFYYSVWCSGEHEFYDMNTDYYQMNNLLTDVKGPLQNVSGPANATVYYERSFNQLISRLDAMLMVMKTCKTDTCRNPYSIMFPKGQVTSLTEAMNETYDVFFSEQPRVSWEKCVSGNLMEFEGTLTVKKYTGAAGRLSTNSVFGLGLWIAGWFVAFNLFF